MGATWLEDVVERTDTRLHQFFETKLDEARRTSPKAAELVEAIAELTQRGGKRLRPCAVLAGYRSVLADRADTATVDVGAALELLQSYLLIQDDWMDGDVERRGGPAVHYALSQRHGDETMGAALAMLAGDMACGFAWELLGMAPFPERRLREAMAAFGRMHFEVVCGQQLDLVEHRDVGLVHDLKSGSYTVRGPLHLGAILAGGAPAQIAALVGFGGPTGVAFQLRDDLLGTFGDPQRTGKSNGNDLRAGKFTSLIAEARRALDDGQFAPIAKVLGHRDAGEEDVEVARALLQSSGARDVVEARLQESIEKARAALRGAPLLPEGVSLLEDLLNRLTVRER